MLFMISISIRLIGIVFIHSATFFSFTFDSLCSVRIHYTITSNWQLFLCKMWIFSFKISNIYLNVDNVADFVHFHVCWKWNNSMLSEWTREHVSGSAAITFWVCHFGVVLSWNENCTENFISCVLKCKKFIELITNSFEIVRKQPGKSINTDKLFAVQLNPV